jgi:DNA-directed RNA polymerase specialized sigma24 family protein
MRLIRRKAKQLAHRPGFTRSDQPDLEQELAVIVLRRLADFDPGRSHYYAFVTTVVERYVATILKYYSAEMRTHQRHGGSLNLTVTDGDGHETELLATLSTSAQELRTGQHRRPHEEAIDLVGDVADVLEQFPERLRTICERLKTETKAAVARDMGLSQGAFYDLLGQIRARFEKLGLRDYLA